MSSQAPSDHSGTRAMLFAKLGTHPAENVQAIDFAHALLIAGLVTAHKPAAALELGVGSAFLTRILLAALAENARGTLTSVDNFIDWNGREPEHITGLRKAAPDWNLMEAEETAFLRTASPDSYDFVVSDGDHTVAYQNGPALFRVVRPGGVLVFHDTNCELFGLLRRLPGRCRKLGFPTAHFTAQSRPDERTSRGLLVVWKDRARPFTLDLPTRLYLASRDGMPAGLREWLRRRANRKREGSHG